MPNRLFNSSAICSTITLCALLSACLFAANVNPAKQFFSLGRGFHISIDVRGSDPRLELFNDASYGPCGGSIIDITGLGHPSRVKSASLDFPGVYYRHFRWPNGATLWTFSLSLHYFVACSAVLPIAWLTRRRQRARRGEASRLTGDRKRREHLLRCAARRVVKCVGSAVPTVTQGHSIIRPDARHRLGFVAGWVAGSPCSMRPHIVPPWPAPPLQVPT
jgi:hypothetical protein